MHRQIVFVKVDASFNYLKAFIDLDAVMQ